MEWFDTHVHISGVSPDGSPRENLARDLVAVMDGAGAVLMVTAGGRSGMREAHE